MRRWPISSARRPSPTDPPARLPATAVVARLLRLLSGPIALASSTSFVLRMFAVAAGFVQAVLAARLLGPSDYGIFAVANAITVIVATAAMLGFGALSVRAAAQLRAQEAWARLAGYLRFSRTLALAVSALAGLALAGVALTVPAVATGDHAEALAIAGALPPLLTLLLLYREQARGLGAIVVSQLPVSLLRLTMMAVILGALYLGAVSIDASDAVLIYVGVNAVALAMAVVIVRRAEPPALRGVPAARGGGRGWLVMAAPFLVTTLVPVLQAEANTVLLTWLSGPAEAGLFQPIARVSPIMVIAMEALSMPLAPRIAQMWIKGEVVALQRLLRLATLASFAVTVAVAGAILLAAPLILGAFGEAFLVGAVALLWIAGAQVLHAATGHAALLLSMAMRQGTVVWCKAAGLGVNVVLGLLLMPDHGATGAAMALAAGIVVFHGSAAVAARLHFGFDISLIGALGMLLRRAPRP